ncbi:cytochrome-c peroxidase [Shewanella sp. UCD-KL12]|uniref:cytochrome-c peroxidase n=1 Tax=Shewanella sp. UCD-KL12 TaxID=1917163 RepID=UPI0009FAB72E|nr:cytochrome c peroxidase [Shewanella sp. UCD-KL12]
MRYINPSQFQLCSVLLTSTLVLTACGGQDSSEETKTPVTPPATDTPVVNTAPVLNLSLDTISLTSDSTQVIAFTASDADNDPLVIQVSSSEALLVSHNSNEITVSTGTVDAASEELISVSVSDGQQADIQTLTVILTPPPEPEPEPIVIQLPETLFDYAGIVLPQHFIQNDFPDNFQFQTAAIESDNTPADNPITNAGATLGRVLFYDTKLSINDTVSCASCHVQEFGFSDPSALSIGFAGGETRRHSMGLANARFYQTGKFFWDERASTLEEQVLMPIQDEVEMGMTLAQLVQTVSAQSYYPELFSNAFGDEQVSSDRIAKALAQFVRAMVSVDAKYDQGRIQVTDPLRDFPNFSREENAGKRLFMTFREGIPPCTSCHSSEAFVGPLIGPDSNATTIASNNGLDEQSSDDLGVFETTGINGHTGKFKVPSLRNVAVRPPYMHDARFNSLEETIEHYSSGIKPHPTLQALLRDQDGNPVHYNFTAVEQADLIAFLHTLTDENFLSDEKFSDPFVR